MFRYEKQLLIRSTLSRVWAAIAEADGVRSWYAPEVRMTPGLGGSIWVSWGPGMEGESAITAWEPQRRFAYSQDGAPGEEPSVVDFLLDPEGDATRLSLTHTGLRTEAARDGVARPWELFLHLMQHGLEHPHRAAHNVTVFRYYPERSDQMWTRLKSSKALARISQRGTTKWNDEPGYRSIVFPDANESITGIFCESCGDKTGLTLMSILYDPEPGQDEEFRAMWTALADEIAAIDSDA